MTKRNQFKQDKKEGKGKQFAKYIIYSRLFWYMLLVVLQLAVFFLFTLRFRAYTDAYLGGSIALSFLFVIYLTNTKGKNEYKLAWLLPLIIFPWFGLFAYIIYHSNLGGRSFKRRLEKVKEQTKSLNPNPETSQALFKQFPEYKNTCTYLLNAGSYHPYAKNQLEYLKTGEEYFPALLESLKAAKRFIFIEYFIITEGEAWNTILQILEQKAKEGVEVRVLYDGFGSLGIATKEYKALLNNKGIKARIFSKLFPLFDTKLNNRDHRKIVVIDGELAFTGGINLSNEYFNIGVNHFPYWKDNGITIKGQAVNAFTIMFLQNWAIAEKNTAEDFEQYLNKNYKEYKVPGLAVPYGDDAFNNLDIAENLYIDIINTAKDYVHITSPYLVIDNQCVAALTYAQQSGTQVSVVLPSKPDHYITFCIGRTYIKDLLDAGIKVYSYNKGFIHQKVVTGDGKMASVGSVNLDYRSFYHHFECGIFMAETPVIQAIEEDFQEILKDCTLITEQEYKKIPKRQLFIGRLSRIFAPLM